MKKLYVFFAFLFLASFSFAQKQVASFEKMPAQNVSVKTPTDTLIPGNMANATGYTIYTSTGGGYVNGNNSYGDLTKAQQFIVTPSGSYIIEGGMFWFGGKETVSGTGSVMFQIWDMDGTTGYTSAGDGNQQCPSSVLASETVPFANVDTSTYLADAHVTMFTTPVPVTSDYAIGIDVTNIGDDTCGLVSTTDGDGGLMELVWEKWSSGDWYTYLNGSGWGIDFDLCILPIVDASSSSINDDFYFNGLKMNQSYPNPAVDNAMIEYELETSAKEVSIEIFTIDGKRISVVELGNQPAGLHNATINVSNFATGEYLYMLVADGKRMVKKMSVVH